MATIGYSWGDDTDTWKKPGAFKFDSARKPYLDDLAARAAAKGPRTYTMRSSPNSKLVTPVNKIIETASENPLIIGVDVTGSMSRAPAEFFDRAPLLYQTLSQHKSDLEISFCAIGDATCDSYPLQVNRFGKGVELDDHINAIFPEGHGGGQHHESYELFAYFMLNNCKVPNAKSPFLLIYGDEGFYENVDPAQVQHYIGNTLQGPLSSGDVWSGLKQKFDVYLLHRPYGNPSLDKEIVGQWSGVLGAQKVIVAPDMERVVDVMMGLVAKKWGKFSSFKDNLSARHDSGEAASVYKSLRYVDPNTGPKSVVTASTAGKASKRLA